MRRPHDRRGDSNAPSRGTRTRSQPRSPRRWVCDLKPGLLRKWAVVAADRVVEAGVPLHGLMIRKSEMKATRNFRNPGCRAGRGGWNPHGSGAGGCRWAGAMRARKVGQGRFEPRRRSVGRRWRGLGWPRAWWRAGLSCSARPGRRRGRFGARWGGGGSAPPPVSKAREQRWFATQGAGDATLPNRAGRSGQAVREGFLRARRFVVG